MEANVSRRSFFKLSIGSFTALPAVAGGFLLPDARHGAEAHAQTLEGTEINTRIVAVSPKQIGLYVANQANGANEPVPGASVTLTSRYNGKSKTEPTSDIGVALFDIADMAEDVLDGGYFCFNGTIDVIAPGYREFHLSLARLTGGSGFTVPTRTLEQGLPYPSRVSFAEWDVLYTQNEFVSTEENDADADMLIEIKNLTEPATLTLRERNSTKVYAQASLVPQNGTATANIHDTLLKSDTTNALPEDGNFFMRFETTKAIYEFIISIVVKRGVTKKFSIEPTQDMSPCNVNLPTMPQISIPDFIPLFGGQKLTPWFPQWSVIPVIDPFGYLYIAYTTPRVGYVTDSGSTDPKRWGVHPYASSSEQFGKALDLMSKNADSAYAAMSRGGFLKHGQLLKNFSIAASLRLEAMAKWDWSTGEFSGDAGAALLVSATAGLTEQFAVGPVPVYIGFLFNLNVALSAMLGFATPDGLDFSAYDWDFSNTGFSLTLSLSGSLTLGVGISGVASVGGRGTLVVTVFLGLLTLLPDPRLPMPHVKVGFSGEVAVEVQFLFFKWSGTLYSFNNPEYYNNWNENALLAGSIAAAPEGSGAYKLGGGYTFAAQPGVRAAGNYLWSAIMNEATPVTTGELAETSEIRLTTLLQGPAPLYEFEPPAFAGTSSLLAEPGVEESALYPWSGLLTSTACQEIPLRERLLASDAQPNVEKVDRELGGVWPSLSMIMVRDIFSDSRTKVIPYRGGSDEFGFMFRIASVEADGNMRSRVVVQAVDRGSTTATRTINFATGIEGIPRGDLFDYDFDVASNIDGTRITLFILSGTRPSADEIDPYSAFETMVFSCVELEVNDASVIDARDGISVVRTFSWQARNFYNINGKKNVFFCPRVSYLGEEFGDPSFVALSWLHRYTTDDAMPLDSADAKTTVGLAFAYSPGVTLTRFEHNVSAVGDASAYDLCVAHGASAGPDALFPMYFAVRGENGTSGVYAHIRSTNGSTLPWVGTTTVGPTHPINCHLTPWPNHTGFLASYENRLVHLEFTADDTMFHLTQIGEGDVCVDSLGTDATGTFVYYAANKNGVADYEVTDDTTVPADPVEENFIVAHKLHKGRFGEPYTMCHVRHSNESLACIGHRGSALAFLSTSITDFNTSKANLWYTVVPSVCTPTLLSVAARNPAVAAGDYAHFLLTIRNDGNVYITGAKVELHDEDGWYITEGILTFNEETLKPSLWNPPAEPSEDNPVLAEPEPLMKASVLGSSYEQHAQTTRLLNTEADYELAPGKTAVYEVALQIPEDWEGEHEVILRLVNVTWVSSGTVASDEQPLWIEDEGNRLHSAVTVTSEDEPIGTTQDAPVSVIEKESGQNKPEEETGKQETNPGKNEDAREGAKQGGAEKGGQVPNTGDSSMLGAAAALGALGAGMVAYSARRAKYENE